MKMTDNEIDKMDFCGELCKYAEDIINRQKAYIVKCEKVEHFANKTIATLQAEKSNLEIELQAMRGAANSYKAEIEKYQHYDECLKDLEKANAEIEQLKDYNAKWLEKCAVLKAENERLNKELDITKAFHKELKAELSLLNYKQNKALNQLEDYRVIAKAEAVKECIEKVKENSILLELVCSGALVKRDYTITEQQLDNLKEELVGEQRKEDEGK